MKLLQVSQKLDLDLGDFFGGFFQNMSDVFQRECCMYELEKKLRLEIAT